MEEQNELSNEAPRSQPDADLVARVATEYDEFSRQNPRSGQENAASRVAAFSEWRAKKDQRPSGDQTVEPQPGPAEEDATLEADERPSVGEPFELALPSDLPAHMLPDQATEHVEAFTAAARAAGLDGSVAQRFLDAVVDAAVDFPYSGELTLEAAASEMERRWGADAPRRLAVVQDAVKKLGRQFAEFLEESGYGNSAPMLEALYRYGSGEITISKADAEKRLAKIKGDAKHPYWDRNLNSHERKRVIAEVRFLNRIANEPAPASRAVKGHRQHAEKQQAASAAAKGEAKAAAQAMLADKKHPLNNRHDPGHAAAVVKFNALVKQFS
jgi:hypothetical protein